MERAHSAAPIACAAGPSRLPLTRAQRLLWRALSLRGQSASLVRAVFRLRGILDRASFEQAVNAAIARHAALRTRLEIVDGEPVQLIDRELRMPVPLDDLSALDARASWRRLRAAIREQREPFDLQRGPLFRVRLLALRRDDHVLLETFHPLIADERAVDSFNRELGERYADAATHRALVTVRPSLPSSDTSAEPVSVEGQQLPSDRKRSADAVRGAERLRVAVAGEQLTIVRRFEAARGCSADAVMVAALSVVLARYYARQVVVIGWTRSARHTPRLADSIGALAETSLVRVPVVPEAAFDQLVRSVEHELDAPCADTLVQVESPPSVYVTAHIGNGALRFGDIHVERVCERHVAPPVDVSLRVLETDDVLELQWTFDDRLFDRWRIATLAQQHANVLIEGCTAPDRRVASLDVLGDATRSTLRRWNETARTFAHDTCVHHLVEWRARMSPQAIAVADGDGALTYDALNRRANQVAHALRDAGVRPDTLVAACVERSVHAAVAWLAILKAGGAFVPIDAAYPDERRTYILQDSGAALVVTDASAGPKTAVHGVRALCLDRDTNVIDAYPATDPSPSASPHHLAYAIYTSGSTGRPKGVQIEHRSLCHYVQALDAALPNTFNRRYLHTASFGFSSSVRQMFAPLCTGGTVVVARHDTMRDAAALIAAVVDERIEVIDVVPTAWRALVGCLEHEGAALRASLAASALAKVLFASEPLTVESIRRWRTLMGARVSLTNLYGQTETTGIVTTHPIADDDLERDGTVPIGRPLANTRAHVLDESLQPVPIGVPGDLYLEGPGVARGYLHRPDLTAARFVTDPSGRPGARLYSTGDRACYRHDGALILLGRTDDQVKIRGCRVELGEVEGVLRSQPAVRDAAVIVDRSRGEPRLVGYVVPSLMPLDAADLTAVMRASLPDYMVPSAVLPLAALPRTPNGKLDRQALAAFRPEPSVDLAEPRTELEQLLCQEFADLLAVERVGVHDDFFALGGHSLLAARLIHRVSSTLGLELAATTLFDAPTVANLAQLVQNGARPDGETRVAAPARAWPQNILQDQVAAVWERILGVQKIEIHDDFFELGGTLELGKLMLTALEYVCGQRLPLAVLAECPTVEGVADALITTVPADAVVAVQEGDPGTRPFFFMHGDLGGCGLYVRELARGLGEERPVYVLQQHGLNGREIPLSIAAMAEEHVRTLRAVQPHGPYLLGGHCNGASVAFEMARCLEAEGADVAAVVMIEPLLGVHRGKPALPLRRVPLLPPEQMRVPPVRGAWLFAQYRAIARHYRPGPYSGTIDLFTARYRHADDLDPVPVYESVAGRVRPHVVPGTHITALGRHVRKLAAAVQSCLARSEGA
jgi:amino acid adenylation domain-containing protein